MKVYVVLAGQEEEKYIIGVASGMRDAKALVADVVACEGVTWGRWRDYAGGCYRSAIGTWERQEIQEWDVV